MKELVMESEKNKIKSIITENKVDINTQQANKKLKTNN